MSQQYSLSDLLLLGIEQEKFPRYLYKYRKIEDAERFLENSKIMFSTYDKFNDPFEFAYILNEDYNENDLMTWFRKTGCKCSSKEISHLKNQFQNNKMDLDIIIDKEIKEQLKNTGVFCLASMPNNLLMWSHYASYHEGVCLEFDLSQSPKAFTFLQQVIYDDNYPHINYIKNQNDIITPLIHKSKAWQYEEEWRVIKNGFPNQLFEVDKKALTSVIFGCSFDQTKEKSIQRLCAEKGFNAVQYKRAVKSSNSFHLDIVDVDTF